MRTKKILSIAVLSLVFLLGFEKTAIGAWNPYSASAFGLPNAGIYQIITNILDWLLTIVGIAGVIGFIISGFRYLMVSVDEKAAENAKKAMTNSIIGIVVALSGVVVLMAVDSLLNAGYLF